MAFFVDVITTPRNDPTKIVHERRINYDNSRSRQWLAGHSNWALRSGHAVHTAAANLHGRPMVTGDLITLSREQINAMRERL